MKKTGVEYHADRIKPYTVWVKGNVVWFTKDKDEADEILANPQKQLEIRWNKIKALRKQANGKVVSLHNA